MASSRRKTKPAAGKAATGKGAAGKDTGARAQASGATPADVRTAARLPAADGAAARLPARRAAEDLELGQLCARAAVGRQARDVRLLFVGDRLGIAEYFVLATVHNRRQARAIRDAVREEFKAAGLGLPHSTSEDPDGRWSLFDYGVVVLHVFDDEGRRYFDLDTLWSGAEEIRIEGDDAPAGGRGDRADRADRAR